jgi:hypothetical protein
MAKAANVDYKALAERIVRNEDIFCSLLFDYTNRILRVVDFRGGNFQSKHEYLEQTLMKEGMRKIFTLIERDDINGWQRVGYHREGAIPGYYKRSDAYIMSRIYDVNYDFKEPQGEEIAENKVVLNDIKAVGKKLADLREPSIVVKQVTENEAYEYISEELARMESKAPKTKARSGVLSFSHPEPSHQAVEYHQHRVSGLFRQRQGALLSRSGSQAGSEPGQGRPFPSHRSTGGDRRRVDFFNRAGR